jgi:hypothetical protein
MNNIAIFLIVLLIFFALFLSFPKIESFEQKPQINCDPFMSMYGDCNNFLDTIYNGGIKQTPIVNECARLCREKAFEI